MSTISNTLKSQAFRRSPAYSWESMKKRCKPDNAEKKHLYADRGISYPASWESFAGFYKDMGPRPAGMTLDRKNNDKSYSKRNCRWATPKEQGNNRGDNVLIEFNGVTKTKAQWDESLGMSRHFLQNRLSRGWSIAEAFTTPVRAYAKGGAL